jgi:GWxTD domain-containing protein
VYVRTISGVLAMLLVGMPGAGAASASAQSAAVAMHFARFWRGDGQTLVEGMIALPVRAGTGLSNTVQVELVVRDSASKELHREAWTDTISDRLLALARARGNAEFTRLVSFAVRPGRYTVLTRVARGAQRDSAQVALQGFAQAPIISDALVSSRIRALGANEQAGAAELKKGRFAIETGPHITIPATDPTLWYYLELYPVSPAAANVELEFAVARTSGGAPLFRTQRPIALGERGGVDAARLPLQGLPPGDYALTVTAKAGPRSEQRKAAFSMGSVQEAPVVVTPAAAGAENVLFEKYFAPGVRPDDMINRMIEALSLASPGESVPAATMQLPIDAKRRYLARFWSRIPDPRPTTTPHELLEEYAGRVDFVVREYVEKDIGRSGVRTDRGRIYMKYGSPDAKQLLPMQGSRAVEVWKYTRNRALKFAFLDETGISNFRLVYTTDPTEVSLADWAERIRNVDTVRLIMTF